MSIYLCQADPAPSAGSAEPLTMPLRANGLSAAVRVVRSIAGKAATAAVLTVDRVAGGKVFYNFTEAQLSAGSQETELCGVKRLLQDKEGQVFHTYSTTPGVEGLIGTVVILDRAPKGRNESRTMNLVRRRGEYEETRNETKPCFMPARN
jgi:predicted dithiol-disulfide oxidoreductase (DUF899 family)